MLKRNEWSEGVSKRVVNRLEEASSSYLRSARQQPVHWQMWGEEAFRLARAEGKPILLDIGAVWCHWCHVMDRESYENPEIARLINENFVAIKVDRDERPDVDARLQSAAVAISGQGGWPLTAFLTPDGLPYFAGTYFPPEDRMGRPGMRRVLQRMAQVWREEREQAVASATEMLAMMQTGAPLDDWEKGGPEVLVEIVDRIAGSALALFDEQHGGFGFQPKFPHPAVLDLLLQVAMSRDNDSARDAFELTLKKMAMGGIYDHLAGGFHRYSVDEHWGVPHFEKMLSDNTELLRNYVHGFQSLVLPEFLATAKEIVHWLDTTMSDRERGGFYASQDADINLDDDGNYFTWSRAEAREVLTAEEFEVAARYWDIGEMGEMRHDPSRNVLYAPLTLAEMAMRICRPEADLRELLSSAKRKMLAARDQRPTPFIDRTLYTAWNAMAVTAYLETARVLRMEPARKFALRTLTRLLEEAWDGESVLNHVIAYGDPTALPAQKKISGTLDDYAFTIHACVDAWFGSGRMEFYRAAIRLADAMIGHFYDSTDQVFNDTAAVPEGKVPEVLTARRRPVQDVPTPAGNPVAASALLRLEVLSGRAEYRRIAEGTLLSFAGQTGGLYSGSYGLAVERLLCDPLQVIVVGSGPEAARLEALAVARYAVNKTVMRIAPFRLVPNGIPPALAEMLAHNPASSETDVRAIVCRGRSCLPMITEAEALLEALES